MSCFGDSLSAAGFEKFQSSTSVNSLTQAEEKESTDPLLMMGKMMPEMIKSGFPFTFEKTPWRHTLSLDRVLNRGVRPSEREGPLPLLLRILVMHRVGILRAVEI